MNQDADQDPNSNREAALTDVREAYAARRLASRARLWDRSNRGFGRLAMERDAAIIDCITRSLVVGHPTALLDVGCGTGSLARLTRDAGLPVRYHGIDLMADRIAEARRSSPDDTFVEGSADRMPFEAATFDVASAITLFSSLPAQRLEADVASEIARVLRPGGVLVWYDIRLGNPWNRAVHGLDRQRLGQLFPGWRAELRTFTLLPPVARRLGATTPLLYPALHAVPVLRSHLVGTMYRPG